MTNGSLVLYGTSGCHLCEVAEQLLIPWVTQGITVELIDIAEDDGLFERYGAMIPVLESRNDDQLLSWPFDECSLRQFIIDHTSIVDQVDSVNQVTS